MEKNEDSSNKEVKKEEHLTPRQLIKKHAQDPNHVVTDDELRRLKVGAEAEDENLVNKEADAKKEEIEGLPGDDDLPNPYSILGS